MLGVERAASSEQEQQRPATTSSRVISASGHTNRGRVKQKSNKRARIVALGKLRCALCLLHGVEMAELLPMSFCPWHACQMRHAGLAAAESSAAAGACTRTMHLRTVDPGLA